MPNGPRASILKNMGAAIEVSAYTAAPRREKKADPNSPFAVLAGLKAELSSAQKNNKAKEPEKAE